MTAKPAETASPWTPDSRLRTTVGTIGLLIALTATAVAAWMNTRAAVGDHTRTLEQHETRIITIETRAREDHDILVEIRADQKALMRELSQHRAQDLQVRERN
jgi:hypothetical protein